MSAVAVIIPLYNKRGTIERTVRAVLAQTLADFELVVVDDGSSDGGAELVQAVEDPRVRLVRQANAGPAAARNSGAARTSAPLLAFVDADDEWAPGFLEEGVRRLNAHPDCAAFTCSYRLGALGQDRWSSLRAYGFHEGTWQLTPDIPQEHLRHCAAAFTSISAIYRREIFQAYGGFFDHERCTLGEDLYLWIQILLNHPIYRCMTPLAHYHTEDSELGIGARQGSLPLEPVLTHPEPLRAACPPELRDTLERWLGEQAIRAAFLELDRGGAAGAAAIVRRFPQAKRVKGRYWRLRARIAAPRTWALLRRLTRRSR